MRIATKGKNDGGSVPEAILFDLDGTLYDMRLLAPLLGLASFRDLGRLAAFFAARVSKAGLDFGSREALLDALALDASLRLSGEDPETLRRWYDECLYGRFVAVLRTFFRARPCVRRFLAERGRSAREAGRVSRPLLGVLSDYGHVDDRIHAIGLDPLQFDLRLSNEDEGALKPAPRPYLRAAELFGVECGKVLVVGDRDDLDGAGAAAAGMAFVRVATSREVRAFFCGLTKN
jgi:FMN phosphatase YigB (HAD superfamily)